MFERHTRYIMLIVKQIITVELWFYLTITMVSTILLQWFLHCITMVSIPLYYNGLYHGITLFYDIMF